MKSPFKESPELIEKELYSLINLSKGEAPFLDSFILKISSDYFLFQQNLLNIANDKTFFSLDSDRISFNDLIKISIDMKNNNYLSLQYNPLTDMDHFGLSWSGIRRKSIENNNSNMFIIPLHSSHIKLFEQGWDDFDSKEKIQDYFFNHLIDLDNKFNVKLNKLPTFLIPLEEIFLLLKNNEINIFTLFNKKESYDNIQIYNTLKENKSIISLTSDIDITSQLESMSKHFFSNKIDMVLK